jgi:formamidopyrimidine-DNA glycosylase
MPELPEVETVARGLAPLAGLRIAKVEQHRKNLRFPLPRDLASRLVGQHVTRISRRAKYLLLQLSGGETLLVHLGMSGRLVINSGERKKHDHLVLHFTDGQTLIFNDPRRFGMIDLFHDRHKLLQALGPEPLSRAFTPKALAANLKGKKTALKLALLDQRVVAGLGNIYVCEALYHAGLSPKRMAGSVSAEECARLVPAIKKVLKAAIRAGGSSLRDYVQASGELGYFQHNFAVYGREGQPCPTCTCRESVRRFTQGGRSTFWCAQKQR